ncbi:MAG: molybdate ABC transporter substrate-binding protein [Kiritimatiellae bacterium]|nr:molybdate ABC transporter substrate-binding protein [Kiritimatiellia bacterium]
MRVWCTLVLLASAVLPGRAENLTVFAAASLTESFRELAAQFERGHPGVAVTLNLGSSSQLAQQLSAGAPADVFASADEKQMQVAVQA